MAHTILSLLAIIIEILVLCGLGWVLRETVVNRSGLNDPEKLLRIWRRSQEIRFQPVFNSLIFSVVVGYGAPNVLTVICLVPIAVLGLQFLIMPTTMLCFIIGGCVAPIIYRASSGQNMVALICAMAAMTYLMVTLMMSARDSTSFLLKYILVPFMVVCMQAPGIVVGLKYQLPAAVSSVHRVYTPKPVPEWVRLPRSISLSALPLFVTFLLSVLSTFLGSDSYISRLAIEGSRVAHMAMCVLVSIVSVNRSILLSDDWQWHWRAALTPGIPTFVYLCFFVLLALIFEGGVSLVLAVFMIIGGTSVTASCGVLGGHAYLYMAEKYAQSRLAELDGEQGIEEFAENESDGFDAEA